MKKLVAVAACLAAPLAVAADGPIQDNSFLVEEAYNQEDGVVQHINTFQRFQHSRDWIYTFTQEWPVGGLKHQFSYTVPVVRPSDSRSGVGDIAINYRYQLVGDGEAKVAVAPRFTVSVPSGNESQGRGEGTASYQAFVPVSVVLSPEIVAHSNAGYTRTPKTSRNAWNVGQSFVWLASQRVNLMLEAVYSHAQDNSAYVSPGVRWSYDFDSGLQIVPGIAFPIGVGPSRHEKSVFLYLSFEHPFTKRAAH